MSSSINMEVVQGLSNSYVEYIEEVNGIISNMFEELVELMNEQRYEPLYNSAKSFDNTYNEEVKKKLTETVRGWAEGDNSFLSAVKKLKLGEDSVNTATNAQDNIVSAFEEKLQRSSVIADYQLSLSETLDRDVLSSKLEEICTDFKSEIDSCVDDNSNQVKSGAEDNMAIEHFVHINDLIAGGLKEFAEKALENFKDCLDEETRERFDAADQMKEQAWEEARIKTEQIMQDAIAQLDAELDSLFDD